jgi:hypothetical protein
MSADVLDAIADPTPTVLTGLVQHLVTLVENKVLQVGEAEMPVADKRVDATGCSDNDVGVGVLVAEELNVLLDGCTAVEDADLYIRQELCETVVLVPDLVGQFAGVTHDENGCNARLGLLVHLLESGEDEDGRLSETGLGLAENVVAKDGLRNGNLLDCRAQRHVRIRLETVETKR